MRHSPRPRFRRAGLLVAVAALTLGACGTEAKQADDPTTTTVTPDPDPTPEPVDVWAPAGSSAPTMLDDPGPGETITVRVGERVQVPELEGFDGIEFTQDPDDHLVRYGAEDVFLAVEPGIVHLARTKYDPERSCVPPQPVSEFTLLIADGDRPYVGEPVPVTDDDDGATFELVPGQRLDIAPEHNLSVDEEEGEPVVLTASGEALRPGTVEASFATESTPTTDDDWVTFTVVVAEPPSQDGDAMGVADAGPDEATPTAVASSLRSAGTGPALAACGG